MKRNDLSKYREQFIKAARAAITECSRETGITDVDTVDRYLAKSASTLFKRISVLLAKEQRRILIQKLLKRCTVSVRQATDKAFAEAAQAEFDFFEIEQFRGLARRISYREGAEVKYVEYNRSLEWQRLASISLLSAGIAADIARRDAEIAANNFLQKLVKKHGDLPAELLAAFWWRGHRGDASSGSGS